MGIDDNRSWNSGWEGDDDVSDQVMALRRRRLRNARALLLLSQGTPMFVAGDEFGRTQDGNNNAYNQDNETSWIDWSRRDDWTDHEPLVAADDRVAGCRIRCCLTAWWRPLSSVPRGRRTRP